MTVTDGRGRRIADGGLARWLAAVLPARVRGEVAIALITDSRIRKPGAVSGVASAFRRKVAGDVVIATGVAKRQAREAGHSYRTELRVLALHGFLHLLGYDHDAPDDHGRMARAEARLRRRGGLPIGVIARAGADG